MAGNIVIPKLKPLEKAQAVIAAKQVFFAAIVLSTMFVVKNNIPTAATDYLKVYYSEGFLARLDLDEIIFVILHEIMHILMKHGLRRGDRDPSLWNIACDHKINRLLQKMGFKLIHHPDWKDFHPEVGFVLHCNPAFDDLSEEQIYDILKKQRDEQEKHRKGQPKPAPGRGTPQRGWNQPKPEPGKPNPGDGTPDGLGGDLLEKPGMTEAEKAKVGGDIDKIVARAATIAKGMGKMPGELEFLIQEYFEPQIRWQDLLRRFASVFIRSGSSWLVRNKRHHNMYLPGKRSTQLGEVIIVTDSSGSMFDETIFKYVGSEINGIIQHMKPELVRVIWADDADCNFEEHFKPGQSVVLHPHGGGGTDMRKPLEFIKKYKPIFAILITDGLTPWPDHKLPYPLIICCTTGAGCPEWAMTVRVTIPD